MKLIVNVENLRQEINKALSEYQVQYVKLVKLYSDKVNKYSDYVNTVTDSLNDGKVESQLKYPPSPPTWLRDNFLDTLDALSAHTEEQIELSAQEYNTIKDGLQRLRDDITSSTANYNALIY